MSAPRPGVRSAARAVPSVALVRRQRPYWPQRYLNNVLKPASRCGQPPAPAEGQLALEAEPTATPRCKEGSPYGT